MIRRSTSDWPPESVSHILCPYRVPPPAEQVALLTGKAIAFDPAADEATRAAQIEAIQKALDPGPAETTAHGTGDRDENRSER